MSRNTLANILLIHIPDFVIILCLIGIYFIGEAKSINIPYIVYYAFVLLLIIKNIAIIYFYRRLYINRILGIKKILSEFQKGKFSSQKNNRKGKDELTNISEELSIIGKLSKKTKRFIEIVITRQREKSYYYPRVFIRHYMRLFRSIEHFLKYLNFSYLKSKLFQNS